MGAAFLLFLILIPCASAAVDPALAGSWSLDAPGAQLVWQVSADGHYQLLGSLSDSGTLEAGGGKWTTVSAITGVRQNGTYAIEGRVLQTNGPLGAARWAAETAQNLAGGLIPRALPKLAQDALAAARRTAPDAVLVMIEVKDPAPLAHPVELRFYSKRLNHVYISSGAGTLDLGIPNYIQAALPATFLDLSRAVEAARGAGMRGVFGHALLRVAAPAKGPAVAVWQVAPKSWDGAPARSIDATSGKALDPREITPMTPTDGEITEAVGRAKAAVPREKGGNAPAANGAVPKNIVACGFETNFVDVNSDYDKPVTFPAIQIQIPVYTFLGDFKAYVPLRPLRPVEERGLSKGVRRLGVDFPPGVVYCDCLLDFHSADVVRQRLQEIAESGCQ